VSVVERIEAAVARGPHALTASSTSAAVAPNPSRRVRTKAPATSALVGDDGVDSRSRLMKWLTPCSPPHNIKGSSRASFARPPNMAPWRETRSPTTAKIGRTVSSRACASSSL
jgi:hypothetical protein